MTGTTSHSTTIATRRARAGKNEDYLARRANLVKTAAELFDTQGLNETSLADIAAAAGLDRASIYYYFSNWEEIVGEVLRGVLNHSLEELERIANQRTPPDEKLRRLIIRTMELFDQHYPHLFVYVREDLEKSALSQELQDFFQNYADYTSGLYQKVIADGVRKRLFQVELPIEIATAGLLGAVTSAHWWYEPGGPIPPAQLGDGLARLLISGLGVRS